MHRRMLHVERMPKNKFRDAITINKPKPTKPQIKITGVITDTNNADEVKNQIIEQNQW